MGTRRKCVCWIRVVGVACYFLLSTACATQSACIEAKSDWSYGSHIFPPGILTNGHDFVYDVVIPCSGKYWISIGFTPSKTVETEKNEKGKKGYVRRMGGSDGTMNSQFLDAHVITYRIRVSSLENPDKTLVVEDSRAIPPYPFGFSPLELTVPRDFGQGDKIAIEVQIVAANTFFIDYAELIVSISVAVH